MEPTEPKNQEVNSEKLDKNTIMAEIEQDFWHRSFYQDMVKLGAKLSAEEWEELDKAWNIIKKLMKDHPEARD